MNDNNPNTLHPSPAWSDLLEHFAELESVHMRDLFKADPQRASQYSIRHDGLLVDFAKHRITSATLAKLINLAKSCDIEDKISAMFKGEEINTSEKRPALHTLLRRPASGSFNIDGKDALAEVHEQLARMRDFSERLHRGEILGASGKAINRVINIGIGGSDLGPRLAVEALSAFAEGPVSIDFVSNLDPKDVQRALSESDPECTMLLVASKSFTTLETRTNADAALAWLSQHGCKNLQKHIVALTTNQQAARDFGASDENIFYFWDWVGGRYSLWSVVGMPLAIAIGMDNFEDFLAGAHSIDEHFQHQSLDKNIPVVLGLLSVWYNNFFKADTHAVIPYDQSLKLFPEYLSQLVMESNGKSVSREGNDIQLRTSPVLWGTIGTNAQHAFFQLLHQGSHLVPIDFLLAMKNEGDQGQQLKLVSNCLAQSEALMLGQEEADNPYKQFPGNTPSTTFSYDLLTPKILGMLIAIYEHKTFVESVIWDINPFDQWGVELGKKLASKLAQDLSVNSNNEDEHDSSTLMLMADYQQRNTE